MLHIEVNYFGKLAPDFKKTVIENLSQVGISTAPAQPLAAPQSGILFFSEVNAQLCEQLRDISHCGLERVLAIATNASSLTKGCAWSLISAGAADVFAWDHSSTPAQEIAARFKRWREVDDLVASPLVKSNLTGQSIAWIRKLREIIEVARFTDASVLITGESGTGKELIARLIHTLDRRTKKNDLVIADCTTIVPELSGSEFFGHERGAFTGAVAARDGAFALANEGTLFLDEVGELPLQLQAELLRVVQEHTYKRVGSNTWQKTNFRLICATNRNLIDEQVQGQFRRDLYYRIATWTCHLPPLRERREDIIPLACRFINEMRPDNPPELDNLVRDYLLARDYPGNVRDLKQLVARIVNHHVGAGPITIGDIPEDERLTDQVDITDWRDKNFEQSIQTAIISGIGLKEIGRAAEDIAERIVLGEEQGNLQRAASRLGVTDRALQMRRAARRQNGVGNGVALYK